MKILLFMSQKPVKGKKKGKGGSSGKLSENDFWDGFKKEWLECESEQCKV